MPRLLLRFVRPASAVLLALSLAACAEGGSLPLGELLSAAGLGAAGMDDATVAAGLREALAVGTERTVQSTSARDGYLANPLIRIPLPEELDSASRALRALGFGAQVDELELGMNRAAESAAGEAADVFGDAIRQLTFADARAILGGGERAATDYFEQRTSSELRLRFRPIVDTSMQQVGLARAWDQLVGTLRGLPLVPQPKLDLREYVTDQALDGLFSVLAQEESRIRSDPAARSTELLRSVFGR